MSLDYLEDRVPPGCANTSNSELLSLMDKVSACRSEDEGLSPGESDLLLQHESVLLISTAVEQVSELPVKRLAIEVKNAPLFIPVHVQFSGGG